MPILAAPLEAMAVLCRSGFLPHVTDFMAILSARLCSGWHTNILHYKSQRGHTITHNRCVSYIHRLFFTNRCLWLNSDFFISLWARVRGQPSAGAGWQAVATDGDEQVELSEGRQSLHWQATYLPSFNGNLHWNIYCIGETWTQCDLIRVSWRGKIRRRSDYPLTPYHNRARADPQLQRSHTSRIPSGHQITTKI